MQYNTLEIEVTIRPIADLCVVRDMDSPDGAYIRPNFNDSRYNFYRFLQPPPSISLDAADYWGHDKPNNNTDGKDDINAFQDEEKDDNERTGGAFGKQKHDSSAVATCEIRKEILAQHFNVAQTS